MTRPPDSRVTGGQRLEDELDAITDSTRRDTFRWVDRLMRAHPGNRSMEAAVIAGIAGGLLDRLLELASGDMEKVGALWEQMLASYRAAMSEDEAADAQPVARQETPDAG